MEQTEGQTEIATLAKKILELLRRGDVDDVESNTPGIIQLDHLIAGLLKRVPPDREPWSFSTDGPWTLRDEQELTRASTVAWQYYDARSKMKEALNAIQKVGGTSVAAFESLGAHEHLGPGLADLILQRLWAILFFADSHSRRGHHTMAKGLLELARRKLEALEGHGKRGYTLQARIAYSLGSAHLHLGELMDARTEFRRTVDYTMLGLDDHVGLAACASLEGKYARYLLAKAFAFGLTRVHLGLGEVSRALATSAAGCVLFAGIADKDRAAYARMVYAMCLRAQFEVGNGDHRTSMSLERAEKILVQVAESFEQSGSRHRKRAYEELARVNIHKFLRAKKLGTPDARRFLVDARKRAEQAADVGKTTPTRNAFNKILLSRIARHEGDFSTAMEEARDVIQECGENQREWKVAALIALGEAFREWAVKRPPEEGSRNEGAKKAEGYFQAALQLTLPQSLNASACCLHLVLCATAQKDTEAAQRYMRQWQEHNRAHPLENGVLRDLEKSTIDEFNDSARPDFIIPASDAKTYTWDELTNQLRYWLVQRSETDSAGGLEAAAAQLGISRATIYNWKRDRDRERNDSGKADPVETAPQER